MSYDLQEQSLEDGQPNELYEFAVGAAIYRLTSGEDEVTIAGEEDAVAEDILGEVLDILRSDESASFHEGARTGHESEVDGRPGGGTGPNEGVQRFVDEAGAAGDVDQIDDVFFHGVIDVDAVQELAALLDLLRLDHGLGAVVGTGARHPGQDLEFFTFAGVVDGDLEQEAIELCFGKLIGSFLIDRVLRGEDQKGFGKTIGFIAQGDLPFLHGLQKCGLHLGGSAVDLIRQNDVGEDRAELGGKFLFLRMIDHGADEIGREEVRSELQAGEGKLHGPRERFHRKGLGQARHSLEEDVPFAQEAQEEAVDEFVLAHQDLRNLVFDPFDPPTRGLDLSCQLGRVPCFCLHKFWRHFLQLNEGFNVQFT